MADKETVVLASPDIISLLQAIKENTAKPATTGGQGGGAGGDEFDVVGALKKVGSIGADITLEIAQAGRSVAERIGTTFSEGVTIEFNARAAYGKQLFEYGANLAATVEQIQSVQQSVTDAFINVPEGFQVSSAATAEFASQLKKVFGGEFKLTGETLRTFGLLGLDSIESLESFRKSTGRAGLTNSQYERAISRNLPSLLIFGNRLAKSAVDLAQLGISLDSYRSTQQGVVTNLEGTLDTVNQLNQLGARIEFGKFIRISELGDPSETFRYLNETIPKGLLKTSTSFRALTEQLPGVKVDDLLRGSMEQPVMSLEQQLIAVSGENGALANFAAALAASTEVVKQTTGLSAPMLGLAAGGIARLIPAIAGFATPIGLGVTALSFLIPALMGMRNKPGDDIVSGYGTRTLLTPDGAISLNNNDTVIAGTKLFSEGSVKVGAPGVSNTLEDTLAGRLARQNVPVDTGNFELSRKVDKLIDTLSNATTTINVGGSTQTVPRMQLVGVYSRNEMR